MKGGGCFCSVFFLNFRMAFGVRKAFKFCFNKIFLDLKTGSDRRAEHLFRCCERPWGFLNFFWQLVHRTIRKIRKKSAFGDTRVDASVESRRGLAANLGRDPVT